MRQPKKQPPSQAPANDEQKGTTNGLRPLGEIVKGVVEKVGGKA